MKVRPLACESLGVRAQAVTVETDETKLLIDPGASLGPTRYGLPPHPEEYRAIKKRTRTILNEAEDADALTISHYHFDHYVPSFQNYRYNWCDEKMSRQLFQDKTAYVKHTT